VCSSASKQEVEGKVLVVVISLQGFSAHLLWEAHLHEGVDFVLDSLLLCEVLSPLLGRVFKQLLVVLQHVRNLSILGII
jgi:hypothetical protein